MVATDSIKVVLLSVGYPESMVYAVSDVNTRNLEWWQGTILQKRREGNTPGVVHLSAKAVTRRSLGRSREVLPAARHMRQEQPDKAIMSQKHWEDQVRTSGQLKCC